MGPEGGKLVLDTEPRLRVTFPKNAVYKKIKVGLQVQSVSQEIVQAAFGRSVEVSRIVAVEPRRRKFHQPIFVSIPLPCPASKLSNNSLSIRLICSITGSMDEANWEDLTGSTPLELCKDVVHFSTKVSGIFWLLVIHDQQRDTKSALTQANRLFKEASLVPYLARFSVFYRENFPRAWVNTVRIYCMTDDKAEKVIQSLQGFRPLAISGDVEISNGSQIAVKLNGNVLKMKQDPFTSEIVPVSTIRSSDIIKEPFIFRAFEENSLTLLVQPKDPGQPMTGSLSFARRLTDISATQQISLCKLDFDVESKEVKRGDAQAPYLDAYEQPIKEEVMFTAETPESQTTDPVESSMANGYNKPKCEKENKVPSEDVEEDNPYEKVEVSNSVMLDRKAGRVPKADTNTLSSKKMDQIPKESVEIVSNKKTKEKDEKTKLPNKERQLNSNGSATLEKRKTKEKKKSKGFSNDDLESYRTEFAKTQGVKEVVQNISKDTTSTLKKSAKVDKSDRKLIENGHDIESTDTVLAKTASEEFASKEKHAEEQKLSNIEVEDKKVDKTTKEIDPIEATKKDLNVLKQDHGKSLDKKTNILLQEIDMTEFRNLAYEREQERIDKLMKKKNFDTGLKEDQCQVLSKETGQLLDDVGTEKVKITTWQENLAESSEEGKVEGKSDITTTLQKPFPELSKEENVEIISDCKTQNIDLTIAKDLQENKCIEAECHIDKDNKNKPKVQEDMKFFRNISYEREQERIDKLMKAKMEAMSNEKDDINHDNIKKPSVAEKEESLDPAIAQHIKENIFINVEKPDSIEKNVDMIESDLMPENDEKTQSTTEEPVKEKTASDRHVNISDEQSVKINSEEKKKKKSFIKDWQQDLKEFFSLGKGQMKKEKLHLSQKCDQDENTMENDVSRKEEKNNEEGEETKNTQKCLVSDKTSEHEDVWERNLDPEIAKHIHENIFISTSNTPTNDQEDKNDIDIIKPEETPPGNNKNNEQPPLRNKRNRKDRRKTNSDCITAEVPAHNEATKRSQDQSTIIQTEEIQMEKGETITKMKKEKTVQKIKNEETVQYRKETSILSTGGKPKVVVPSPKGIPRPLPIKKTSAEESKRDSIISKDSFDDIPKVADSSEFEQEVDSFEQLYLHQEAEETMRTSMDCETLTKTLTECQESKSFEIEDNSLDESKSWKELKRGKSFETQEYSTDSYKNDLNQGQEFTKVEQKIINIQEIPHQYEESKLVQVLRDFQASEENTVQSSCDGQVRYSKVEKNAIQRSMEAQESIQSSLQEIERMKIQETDETNVIRIQKHSLTLQDGELVETTTIKTCSPGEFPLEKELSIIDPESVRNVDGQSRQRKGSKGLHERKEKIGRRQGSKSKSPGESMEGCEDEEFKGGESQGEASDLTARLEETTKRMRKVSKVLDGESEVGSDEVEHQQSAYPLARTSQVVVKSDGSLPLDNVIEMMVKRPEENLSISHGEFSNKGRSRVGQLHKEDPPAGML